MKWCSEVLFVRYLNIGTAAGTQPSPPSHPHTAATSLDLEVSVSVYSAGGPTEVFPRSLSKTGRGVNVYVKIEFWEYCGGMFSV